MDTNCHIPEGMQAFPYVENDILLISTQEDMLNFQLHKDQFRLYLL